MFLLMNIALKTEESTLGIESTIDLMAESLGLAKKFIWLVNTLFNKVLAENEKYVFYFYLKIKGNIWLIEDKRMGTLCTKI